MPPDLPGPHPEPPEDLAQRDLPLTLSTGPVFRIHRTAYEALYFGRSGNYRFDAPTAEYGVLYAAVDAYCAFIETLGHSTGTQFVTTSALGARAVAQLEVSPPLRLVDLTSAGLARLGADERLCVGDYAVAQRWALALYQHPAQPDGILYRSRHDPSRYCVAVFDRARDALTIARSSQLSEPAYRRNLAEILEHYGFGLFDDSGRPAEVSDPGSESAAGELLSSAPPPVERGFFRPRTLVSFAIAFALLVFFVRGVDLDFAEVWARIRSANPILLLFAFAVYYCAFLTRALRWRVLLGNVGYSREAGRPMPSVLGLAEIIYLSFFTNCVVPARLGDAYRGYLLKRTTGVSFSTTMGTVLAERLIDVIVLAAMMTTAALVTFRGALPDQANRALVGGLVLTGVGVAGLVAMPRLRPLVERLLPERLHRHYSGLESGVLGSFRRIPLVVGYSVANWLIEGLTLYFVAAAVGVPVSAGAAIVVALVASLLSTVPFTPAGLGVAEAGIVLLLTQLGVEKNAAGAIGLLDRVVTYWSIVLLGAVVYVVSRKK